jgi:hypothetical protein
VAAAGHWALNEKRLIADAGLDGAQALLGDIQPARIGDDLVELLDLPAWR